MPSSFFRWILAIGLFSSIFARAENAHAYPWMIRHGFAGCSECHADPSGGGLLTAYGRAQGEILLRTQYGAPVEDPGKLAEFAFGVFHLPDQVLLGADVRGAALDVKPEGQPATTDLFLMQSDLEGQVALGRVRANASVGFAQEGAFPAAITTGSKNNLVSRLHWVGVALGDDEQFLVRAGRMNLPFGIRSIDHVAFTRVYTRTDTNDQQQHGASFAWNVPHLRGEVMAIAGNFQESPDAFRERGYSAFAEWAPFEKLALGVSSLATHANIGTDPNGVPLPGDLWRQAHGGFVRFSPAKPVVLWTEDDVLFDSQPVDTQSAARSSPGFAGQLGADLEPIQGVHVQGIGELVQKKPDLPIPGPVQPSYRAWGVVNWFFAPHADLRGDLIYESDAMGGQRFSVVTLLGQLHVYL